MHHCCFVATRPSGAQIHIAQSSVCKVCNAAYHHVAIHSQAICHKVDAGSAYSYNPVLILISPTHYMANEPGHSKVRVFSLQNCNEFAWP